ncbi:hypothetical protein P170DRAFT_47026 [Aspergillus steynii IBT 23096]|uniref:Aminoglycoside phosphotransferase domain-containing protein n=1 Tax=Aspergillus steynii IBT 23096 TaxID=1392250 RepID=A0A2I2GS01_9EURO|nr:uncharacterized protein P170DRAFT_47026 [Aspergillus steynii IBT 23096]PLB55656.1 hypothetical protein P170DRAFT_47026 [Aspergillus steynii IBT 23096]
MTDGMLDEGLWTESVLELDHDRWHIGRRLAAKFREQTDAFTQDTTDEFHEVYEAVHIDPSDIPGIMKAKKHDGDPFAVSNEIHREIDNLHYLTEYDCTCTPKLFSFAIDQQGLDDTVPGGYIAYIVMERVPGKDLRDFDQLDHHEKNRVRLAFVEALWYERISTLLLLR